MVNKKIRTTLLAFVLLLSCLFACLLGSTNFMTAFASNISINGDYSDVMEDLQSDKNFDADDYKIDQTDYSLQVITVAESREKELFVYVYQPCTTKNIFATTLNISNELHGNLNYINYKLKFINSRGVFYKYVVENFVVNDEETRCYDISSIFRAWDENLGDKKAEEGSIGEVSFAVAKQFILKGFNDAVSYTCNDVDVIKIVSKNVGFVRYDNGAIWAFGGSCDSHYVAFSTDRQIDRLIEADVYFVETPMCGYIGLSGWHYLDTNEYGSKASVERYSYITETDTMSNDPSWLGGKKYIRDRIQTVDEFISQETLTDDAKANLQDKKWILRFFESKYESPGLSDYYYWSDISDVSILRLNFETDGVIYNLGVVDNKMTGDGVPDNYNTPSDFEKAFKTIIAILLFVLALIILWPILPYIFQFLGWLIKGVWKIICLPFIAIKSIFKKNEDLPSNNKKSNGKRAGKK